MREIQFREALREAMNEEMRRDQSVFLLGEEVAEYNGAYKVSQGMLDEFGPDRVIDTPIAELGFAGIAVGAAANGLRPIVEFMTFNFSLVAIDQIINSAAKMMSMSGGQYSCPMVFRGPTGNAGQLSSQHSSNFENWFANTPGLKVVVPSNPADAKGLLKASIRDNDPVIFMESELMYGDKGLVPDGEYLIPIGKANIVKEGTDVTIVTFGKMLPRVVMPAVAELTKMGINAEVIDLRTVRPIDYETVLASVKRTNRCVVVEEANPIAALSSEIAYNIQRWAFDYMDAPVIRVNSKDLPLPYAPTLIDEILPSVQRTVDAVKAVLYRN
ncbi:MULTISPECIES: pyruvate dehydrogenase complex E1 component subunit beta [Flectobacillus]|uniref:pyruvate dehydrogenase complex E1 component subunit beta n=1 Tax=Flectobacillus TaxID=101 RepID=UPI000BA367B0|nr:MULTISPECIES: pyruvate dehydrogenase complex E1 component subunit beta [Flectobacillus]MDI9868154.1 pyruvate dehydrogenase complex E1 component subunit beta [Flectobacillus roseus]NBA77146.1 pyruvate dehydrogenase complex E1 component subunit beta [Emticicia sp. ODNR4P]PAC33139.1 pyruvate dehydrogenase complex E1 component subunit beta [Flectobacillus sp. BAB-3569]